MWGGRRELGCLSVMFVTTCSRVTNACAVCSQSLDAIKEIIITATVSPVHGQRHFHAKKKKKKKKTFFTHCSSLHASPGKHTRPGSKLYPGPSGLLEKLDQRFQAAIVLPIWYPESKHDQTPRREAAVPTPNALLYTKANKDLSGSDWGEATSKVKESRAPAIY